MSVGRPTTSLTAPAPRCPKAPSSARAEASAPASANDSPSSLLATARKIQNAPSYQCSMVWPTLSAVSRRFFCILVSLPSARRDYKAHSKGPYVWHAVCLHGGGQQHVG